MPFREAARVENRVCRRCLLEEDAGNRPMYELIKEVISAIPDEQRAKETVYRARLNICRECDRLVSGMCALCGCYVEVRACKALMYCPDTDRKW